MKTRRIFIQLLWISALVIYLYLLTKLILFKGNPVDLKLVLTQLKLLMQEPGLIHTRTVNLTPLQEITRDWHSVSLGRPGSAIHLFGNVFAFIPLGILIPVLMGNKLLAGANVLVLSLLLSLAYEVTQLLTGMGVFDVDDLILNTAGGIIGYVLFTVVRGVKRMIAGEPERTVKKRYDANKSHT
ncbi:VanZ family protein [Paenibacillus sp. ACRSA]|uniref:VanZ family protein n=1 Tax=Paenibacillus sp. ACRSA TaxID=2918211 RepID=UPI001EF5099E|nr:VanZ family protein [Paenibacillus sp. ACRSA]MCG7380373.1 VanZ family protein [Paenibacillus sp. ACRSA]